ncbi:unnamed protein product [Adineta steineri]|uniref:Uncharacterized protein n=1 Tax=Adineta steineri TaxID=433720 RepID=A0A814NIG3_9BILA|nr:unnamed protein product [Adineta steineri]CAF1439004.1 unnamed protein product [Adineta steineri]CAF1439369.1 unnamed protein product [Adineta steineri]CAF1443783.1 unnamed protein product [Adineta steineri]
MIYLALTFLLTLITNCQTSNVVHLENCTYSLDLYKEYLNVLWSSNDSRTLHIQAIYSLPLNKTLIPGHIYIYSSQSLALIPLFVQCKLPKNLSFKSYLPFTQCSSTITNFSSKKNYESTRTNLNHKSILSMINVPLLYIGEHYLILSNCSFEFNSTTYRLQSNEIFTFRIIYESPISTNCYSCNRRTSICYDKICQCRTGTIPLKLYENNQFCIDITRNCTLDSQRCLYSKTIKTNRFNEFILILIVLISLVMILFVSLIWYLCRNRRVKKKEFLSSNQSIFTIDHHERTPSTISTIDSIKLSIENEYPKIIGEENNGETIFILA